MMLDDVGCQAHHGEAPSRSHHVPQAMRHCHWCDGPVPTSIMGEYHRTPRHDVNGGVEDPFLV